MKKIITTAIVVFASCNAYAAPIMIGDLTFDESQFADAIGDTTGDITTFVVANPPSDPSDPFALDSISVDEALTDTDINTGVFCNPAPCDIELLFTDNFVVNGLGDDLLIFEQGGLESLTVTINGISLNFPRSDATLNPTIADELGGLLNIYAADLSSFGLADGAMVDSVTLNLIDEEFFGSADPMLVVATNSARVPEPAVIALFAAGLFGIGLVRRRKA